MSGGRGAPRFADLWRDHLPPKPATAAQAPGAPTELDLHGERLEEALRQLRAFVEDGAAAGHRQLVVVHGRGAHTVGGAVLRPAVRDCLWGELRALVRGVEPQAGSADGATTIYLKRAAAVGGRPRVTGRQTG